MSIKNFGGIVHIGTYNDHHKEATFHVPPGTNTADLIRAFMSDRAEDIPSSSVSSECHSDTSSSGAPGVRKENDSRTKKLFLTPDGDEDFTRTEEERNRFLNFLSEHHWSQRQIDCSRDNPINKSIVCFYAKWKHLKYIHPRTGPAPLLRFLTDTCALQRAAEDRAISAILGKMLKSDYDPDIFYDVCDYFT